MGDVVGDAVGDGGWFSVMNCGVQWELMFGYVADDVVAGRTC